MTTLLMQHGVTFYDDDRMLATVVADFLGEGLAAGGGALVVATPGHQQLIEGALAAAGIDVEVARARGALVQVDAQTLLSSFFVDGEVDAALFAANVTPLLDGQARRTAVPVRIFGEMVACLWDVGAVAEALQVEGLWNDLLAEQSAALLCGYRRPAVGRDERTAICDHHDAVVLDEQPEALPPGQVRQRFEHTPSSASAARSFVASTLLSWHQPAIIDIAQVVVSELTGNAVRYSAGRFIVTLSRRGDAVLVSVSDNSVSEPRANMHASQLATSGRGMQIVAALSEAWGTVPHADGKSVWALLRAPEPD
jgi:hypothetical protein